MRFEYIRAIDPPTPHDAPEPALEPIVPQARPGARPGDEPEPEVELGRLLAEAREAAGPEGHASLAAPWPLGIELPSFVGVPLVCERLGAPHHAAAAEPPRGRWRAWLDPSAVTTMTLALAATVAFGMFVVTR